MPIDADTEKRLRVLAEAAIRFREQWPREAHSDRALVAQWTDTDHASTVLTLLDTVDELRRERDEAMVDAKRYRWLLQSYMTESMAHAITGQDFATDEQVAAAIDGALTKQQDAIRERNGENRPLGSTPDANTHG